MTIDVPQDRPPDEVYPVLCIDAIHYSVRDSGIIKKLAAYVILGINSDGLKEVLTIEVGQNESAKYCRIVNRDAITPIFKFSADVRSVIDTTNAIESLNPPTGDLTDSVACSRATKLY